MDPLLTERFVQSTRDADADADADAGAEAPAADDDDRESPLRADAGDAPSEEVEAYTRVIGGGTADDPRSE
jgi:hypothetical protein